MSKESATGRVVLVATPGVPLFEFAAAVEVFGRDRSDLADGWYRFVIAAVSDDPVLLGHGLAVPPGHGLDAVAGAGRADTVVVPACSDVHAAVPGELARALRTAHRRGARVVSLCSGAFVLAAAGLLDGRRAATHWMHADELARRYPRVEVDARALYVRDGSVWTSAGSAAALDLCLEIVRDDHGRAVANEVARRVVTPPHRDGGQAQYVRFDHGRAAGATDVVAWAREHLADATVADMARASGVSARTLVRRFREATGVSPQAWLIRERLVAAQELLESTELTVDAIAARVGLGTGTNLRARFTATFGTGPQRYRHTFATTRRR